MGSAQFKNYNLYNEDFSVGDKFRKEYHDSLESYIKKLKSESAEKRFSFMPPQEFAGNMEKYRSRYIEMLGEPLKSYSFSVPKAEEIFVSSDDLCKIYRVSLEIFPDFKFYGMLFIPHSEKLADSQGRFPLVICQHGGGGTPELCSDMNGENNYNHMTRRVIEYGACVFAPQLYLWNTKLYDVPLERGPIDRELRRYGSGIVSFEIYCVKKAIDYMCSKPYIDPEKIAMHGLSYGGMYTMYTMAADTRIKAGYTCGCFNDRSEPTIMEDLVFFNSGNTFTDALVGALCAPRRLCIDVGTQDKVFDYKNAETEFSYLAPYYEACGAAGNVKFNVWDGGHTVSDTDEGHKFMFAALGYTV